MREGYWKISFSLKFLGDLHVGSGVRLLLGNLHGIQRDEDGFPFMSDTQVRGLVRLGAVKLMHEHPGLEGLFARNFGSRDGRATGGKWSFTAARFSPESTKHIYRATDSFLREHVSGAAGMLSQQFHVRIEDDSVKNLFGYQKTGGRAEALRMWHGNVYSTIPMSEVDVSYILASMRMEDRIGHRRTRGYGRVTWEIPQIKYSGSGQEKWSCENVELRDWLDRLRPCLNESEGERA